MYNTEEDANRFVDTLTEIIDTLGENMLPNQAEEDGLEHEKPIQFHGLLRRMSR